MPRRDIVVVGASAGAFDTLKQLVASLPADFPATVLIVRHTGHAFSLSGLLAAIDESIAHVGEFPDMGGLISPYRSASPPATLGSHASSPNISS